MIRILIADDHALVRNGLNQWLSSIEDLEVVGLASNGREAVDLGCELLPDIVLMDLSMPVMDGITATAELTAKAPQVLIIALTTTGDPQQVNAALDAGAMGYMLKDVEPEVLVANIRAVVAGGLALSPAIAANLFKAGRGPRAIYDSLTPREQEILLLIAAGNPNKQIGSKLGISDKTVKAHCGRIFQRLGVRDRTQAAVWVMRIAPNESDTQ